MQVHQEMISTPNSRPRLCAIGVIETGLGRGKDVSTPSNGLNEARPRRIRFEKLPQPPHEHIERTIAVGVTDPFQFVANVVSREYLQRTFREKAKQREEAVRHGNGQSTEHGGAAPEIDHEGAQRALFGSTDRRWRISLRPVQDIVNTRQQPARNTGCPHVVVRTEFQANGRIDGIPRFANDVNR
jgi:hypothetical protein